MRRAALPARGRGRRVGRHTISRQRRRRTRLRSERRLHLVRAPRQVHQELGEYLRRARRETTKGDEKEGEGKKEEEEEEGRGGGARPQAPHHRPHRVLFSRSLVSVRDHARAPAGTYVGDDAAHHRRVVWRTYLVRIHWITLFILFKMSWPHELSEYFYGDGEVIPELGESVHMVLFLVMVIFLAQAVYLARLGDRVLNKWKDWEGLSVDRVSERTIRKHKVLQSASLLSLANTSDEQVDSLIFSLTRDRFCVVRDLHPADFEFASYLGIALGRTLEELVEVPVKSWVCLEIVLLLAWQVDGLLGKRDKMVGWILAGYALPLMAGLVLAKLRILVQHTAPTLADAERRGQRGSLKAMTNRSIRRRHAQEERSFKKKGAKSPPLGPEASS